MVPTLSCEILISSRFLSVSAAYVILAFLSSRVRSRCQCVFSSYINKLFSFLSVPFFHIFTFRSYFPCRSLCRFHSVTCRSVANLYRRQVLSKYQVGYRVLNSCVQRKNLLVELYQEVLLAVNVKWKGRLFRAKIYL